MKSEQLKALGQKAFALVTGVNPEDVIFEEGVLYHKCKWQRGGKLTHGSFYHWASHGDADGTICITCVVSEELPYYSYPYSWHHLWNIHDEEPIIA